MDLQKDIGEVCVVLSDKDMKNKRKIIQSREQ